MASKYADMLKEKEMKRWYQNVARGSLITADVYLRRLGAVCDAHGIAPQALAKMKDRALYDFLLDVVGELEPNHAGSYIKSVIKAVKSWLAFNDRSVTRKIMIRGAEDTPTLRDERVPTQEELRKILIACDDKARVICSLMAFSGLRPEVLGNYEGDDGLRLGDIPEMEIANGQIAFQKVPAMIVVRPQLSKAGHSYFTFLGQEGCDYLVAYLQRRLSRKEKLGQDSPLVTPDAAKKPFIRTTNIGDAARLALRTAGFSWRPYVLRSYFDTQLMLAESKGLIIRDYRAFFMGHKGDIEHTYTLNKRRLPPAVVEQMRESYAKALKYIQTVETSGGEDVTKAFKRQLLLVAGFKPDEITDEQLDMGEDEFQKLVRERLVSEMKNHGARQKVVDVSQVEGHIVDGWEFVGTLPNRKAIVKLPQLA